MKDHDQSTECACACCVLLLPASQELSSSGWRRLALEAWLTWQRERHVDAEMVLKRVLRRARLDNNAMRKHIAFAFFQYVVFDWQLQYLCEQVVGSSVYFWCTRTTAALIEALTSRPDALHAQCRTMQQVGELDLVLRSVLAISLYDFVHTLERNESYDDDSESSEFSAWAQVKKQFKVRLPSVQSERIAIVYSLPDWLVAQWIKQYGVETTRQLGKCCNEAGPFVLRVNSLVAATREEMQSRFASAGYTSVACALSRWALYFPEKPQTGAWGLPGWSDGAFEVQDQGSQCVADACEAQPGHHVLDICCGTGGKALALAAAVGKYGKVSCWDIDQRKLPHLVSNARRARAIDIVQVLSESELDRLEAVDCVLVDAPCSASGTLRRHPSHRWNRLLEHDARERLPEIQRSIVLRAAPYVKRGGRLVYATCSLLAWENEDVADSLDESLGALGFSRAPVCSRKQDRNSYQKSWTLLPSEHDAAVDGFFIAAWSRS
ncbi:putative ribosomal RNA small subunit methyltransferase B [Porphyridium purpureum]|uniref:Putative ribosomal RNA small subunit methyltransferase B n=1 Tax=Porphyridium purpureum TaxID=35688 RepID=A0A5J4YPH6_PORPP|nr:putative ribosomal RNA small subunit methyltransferase B [Porphyridium purpureum]|eukprot:POR1629..scf249_10